MRYLSRALGLIAAVSLLVGSLGMPTSAVADSPLPPLADVCTHPETVLGHLHSLVSEGLIRNSSGGNESVCEQACRMLGISCFVLASNALSCQSLGVTFASLVATTLCRANSDFSEFIACYQLVSQVARDQRPGIEQILGTRSECQDVAAHCSETCSVSSCGDGACIPSEDEFSCPIDCGCSSNADCDDGDLCTDDLCDGATGLCEQLGLDCSVPSECTAGFCDPGAGCVTDPVPDGTPCEGSGECFGGFCEPLDF